MSDNRDVLSEEELPIPASELQRELAHAEWLLGICMDPPLPVPPYAPHTALLQSTVPRLLTTIRHLQGENERLREELRQEQGNLGAVRYDRNCLASAVRGLIKHVQGVECQHCHIGQEHVFMALENAVDALPPQTTQEAGSNDR